MVVDIGTGTGQAVLRRARREAGSLVIGIDADARALADASRRAAAKPSKGGVPNALFLVEAADQLPGPLAGRADLVTIALPWGSLLDGLLEGDGALVGALRGCLKPAGELVTLLSEQTESEVHDLIAGWASSGMAVAELRRATDRDVLELSSSWGRRLGIPLRRPAWIIRLQRH